MKFEKTSSSGNPLKKWVAIFLLLFLIIPFHLKGQVNDYRFNRLSLDEGVALNLVYTMLQDNQGFIWFGTMYGLVRYDGENYTTYNYNPRKPESISFDDIVSLYEDSNNNLWIGTWGGGLNMLNPERNKFTRFVYNASNENGISDNIIWSITEDNEGNIWIGTGSGGIDKYDTSEKSFVNYKLQSHNSNSTSPVWYLLNDTRGELWAASVNGIYKYDKDINAFKFFEFPESDNRFINTANIIYDESENSLLIGSNSGMLRFDKSTSGFSKINSLPEYRIISISRDHNDLFWIGTNSGLIKYNSFSEEQTHFTTSENANSILGNHVKTVIEDRSGVLWVNSYQSGVSKLVNRKSNFSMIQHEENNERSLRNDRITSLAEDKNENVWIGTYQGLHRYDKNLNTVERINIPQLSKYINTVTMGDGNKIFISCLDKIFSYDYFSGKLSDVLKNSNSEILDRTNINNLLFSSTGELWIGTYRNGIYRLQNGVVEKLAIKIDSMKNKSHDYILKIFEDSQNRIWIGTYGGLYLFNEEKNDFTVFVQDDKNRASISNNYVYSITEDLNGNLWIGTARGLNKFDVENETFTKYYAKDGLPNDVICGVAVDDQNKLWISTIKGISRFDPVEISFRNFDVSDGLQSNLFNQGIYLRCKSGEIYFGGRNGLNVFNPEQIQTNDFDSPIVIASFYTLKDDKQKSRSVSATERIELEYNENTISVYVASFDYSNPDRVQYKYQLKGYNDNWVSNGTENKIKIQNIPPGSYTLNIMGTNSDGIWSSKKASISFIINPPFWQTNWFYIICGLIVIALALLIHFMIVKSRVRSAVKIEQIKKEEAERIRKKTAIDFHDELGHRLTRISLLAEVIKRKLGKGFSEITSLLDQVSNNSAQLYEGTKDFIWAIDPQKDSMYELIIRLKDFGDGLFGNTNIDFEVKGLDENLHTAPLNMDWKRHLTMIFKEGMNNSLKHSNGNRVSLNSKISDNDIELILEDNGSGFQTSSQIKGNGLKNMKGRAEKLHSSLFIDSNPDQGTRILFKGKFPVKSLNFN